MSIVIKEVSGKNELKKFILLPAKIHRGHSNWVPPIYMDDRIYFDSKKNKSFSYCDTILLLAWRNDQVIGRIMGIICRPYNEIHQEQHARFAWMECENDPEVYRALMVAIENWAREKGMTHLVGPLAYSDKDPQGFLIEGYNEPVVIASNCNYPYMVELTDQYGFSPKVDLVVYKIPVPDKMPPVYSLIGERFTKHETDLKVIEFSSRSQVKPYIHKVLGLVNETFTDIYGFLPFSEAEMTDFANRFLFLIDPAYIKVIINGKMEVVAFVLGMDDISQGIRRAKGKLIPFGWIHLLLAARKSRQLNLLLGAVRPDYQGRGLDMMMGAKLIESARKKGKTTLDSHLELEYNRKVRAEMERMGGKVYKRFRIFQKEL